MRLKVRAANEVSAESPCGFIVCVLDLDRFAHIGIWLHFQQRAQSACVGVGLVQEDADGVSAGGFETSVKETHYSTLF